MSNGKPSTAKRRTKRRKDQGKITGEFDFDFLTDVGSIEKYYDILLSDKEIKEMTSEYRELNVKLEKDFLEKTKLDKVDLTFLFLAIALQCVRQYFLTPFTERVDHEYTKKADKAKEQKIKDRLSSGENNTNKKGGYYYRNLEKIIMDGVPYDAIAGGKKLELSGHNHRYKTLGHDPILGWVFGPMNIMTNTLTAYNMQSYHIRNMTQVNGVKKPSIYSNAKNDQILESCVDRLKNEPVAFAASIAKQGIHYNSDVNTKRSLPIPFVQVISPEYAKKLADYGFDMANVATVGKQATYAVLINTIISIIHRMFYNPNSGIDEKLFEIKTRKILMYSNTIATTSNMLYVAFTNDVKKLDIGGAMITIYRVVKDEKFIKDIMHEFVDSSVTKIYDEQLVVANEEFDRLISELGYSSL